MEHFDKKTHWEIIKNSVIIHQIKKLCERKLLYKFL